MDAKRNELVTSAARVGMPPAAGCDRPDNFTPPFSFMPRVAYALLLALLMLFGPVLVLAQSPVSPTEAMQVANQHYEAGEFAQATVAYQAIIDAGFRTADLYYNLGNAYFKQGDLGRAILNYLRAHRLAPRDVDITTNLRIARAQTVDRLDQDFEGTVANLVKVAEEWLTLREAAILALGLWLLLCVLLGLAIWLPGWRRLLGIGLGVIGLFLLIGMLSIGNRLYRQWQYPPAVVVAPQVDVTSGPGDSDQYLVEFNLHAGAEVRLLERRLGWRRIILSEELQGWVPAEAVEPVVLDAP